MKSSPNPPLTMAPWLEQAWMDRYLGRQLATAENEWFEAYLLDKPQLLDRWSTELALRDGMDLLDRQRADASAVSAELAPAQTSPLAHGRALATRRRQWHVPALAASIAIAFGVGFLSSGIVRTDRSGSLIADPTRIVLDASRGDTPGSSVENAASTSEFVLVDALVPADASYVAVRGPGMPERRLAVSKDGVATLLLRRSEIDRIGPLTLLIKAGGRDFEKPLPLTQLQARNPR